MATPNKFSNPDTPCCDCPMGYLRCFVTGPLYSVLCFPCVGVQARDRERKKRQVQRVPAPVEGERRGGSDKAESKGVGGGIVQDAPTAEPSMFDAARPRDQWPVEWRNRATLEEATAREEKRREGTREGKA